MKKIIVIVLLVIGLAYSHPCEEPAIKRNYTYKVFSTSDIDEVIIEYTRIDTTKNPYKKLMRLIWDEASGVWNVSWMKK